MADLQEQLQAILGNPEAMGQITAIAQALTGGGNHASAPPPQEPPQVQEADYVPVQEEPPQQASAGNADLSALLSSLSGSGLPDLDPRLIQIALRVFSEYSAQDDEKAALLHALKPFLSPERQEKAEKAAQIARLSRVVRVAIELLREEGGHV
ncbi:MAG: hypothetical protein PUC36_01000 [Clostridiales bacterium]|nr:hypothetical protein [Clostridiales bacterium]